MGMANGADRPGDVPGFRRMFAPGRLTLGVFFPIEAFQGDEPTMRDQERLARRAEELGFAALWVRDVPLRDPSFGDIGQVYDPWVYLGWIAAQTRTIALATGSIVLPLRHPLHTAKAAASVDQLSGGRLVLGVASGDRPVEFPAFGVDYDGRDALFRENLARHPRGARRGVPDGPIDLRRAAGDGRPRAQAGRPAADPGHRQQPAGPGVDRRACRRLDHLPAALERQAELAARWRAAVAAAAPGAFKPFAQSLYVDLADDPDQPPEPIHLGFRGGRDVVFRFLDGLRAAGVHHVILNFKYAARPAEEVLEEIGREVLPRLEASHPDHRAPVFLITVATRPRPRSSPFVQALGRGIS